MTWGRPPPRVKQYLGSSPGVPALPFPRAALVERELKPIPKRQYLRSPTYRRWVASLPCAHCKRAGPTQAAHSDTAADGKGLQIKATDAALWPGCADAPGRRGCHTIIGSTGTFKREHAQTLAAGYIAETQALAKATGNWPKGWP